MTVAWILKATWLLGAALLAAAAMRRRAAALRFAIYAAAVLALLALPFLEPAMPRGRLDLPAPAKVVAMAGAGAALPAQAAASAPSDWPQWIWVSGALLSLLWSASGYLLSRRRVPRVPMTVGVFRPRVLLPAAADEWSAGMRQSVLLHEQAHIDRRDPLWNLAAQLARAVYWFHPLLWLVLRELHAERERACDDVVLAAGVRPSDYAAHLLTCARLSAASSRGAALAMAAGHHSHLSSRVEAVLAVSTIRSPVTFSQRAALTAACCGLLFPLAAFGSSSAVSVRSLPMYRKLMLPLFAAASAAQSAELSGQIYDASNATVPKAQVVARSRGAAPPAEFKTESSDDGTYRLAGLPKGDYEIEVLKPGFARYQRRGIRLQDNSNVTVSAILNLGEVQETVQVMAQGQARPQQRSPRRVLVGGQVQPVRLLKRVNAVYPDAARAEGREGNVTLKAVIGLDGTIASVTVLPGADPDLGTAAEQAVRQWVYQPTLLNGKPVETVTTVEVNFRLGPA